MLRPVGECFVQLQIGKKVFRDRVVVIKNLRCKYILGQVLHQLYWFSTGYTTTGKHYITRNGQVIAQAISQSIDYPILKTKGKVTLPLMSVSIIEVKTPDIPDTTNLYELNADTFQLPEGVILLDILHRVNHKTPQHLNIPILNAKMPHVVLAKTCQLHLCTLWGSAMRSKRSVGADSSGTPLNYIPRYHEILVYNWNQPLKLYLVLFQMQTLLRRPGKSSRNF